MKFKEKAEAERYLNMSDLPLKSRNPFCAFTISCHDFEIERGRYSRRPKSPEKRMCNICNIQLFCLSVYC